MKRNREDHKDDAVTSAALPRSVPRWVLERPTVPDVFSRDDRAKGRKLDVADITPELEHNLLQLKTWWMKELNLERVGRFVQEKTASTREQLLLCFFGFVWRYKCVRTVDELCLGLFLNRALFESYLQYLVDVRQNQRSTLVEVVATAIYVVKWIYRVTIAVTQPPILRVYMQQRNAFFAEGEKARSAVDREDLEQQNRWLPRSHFTALIARLREEWDEIAGLSTEPDVLTVDNAIQLHDLLVLGLQACLPGRGAETRLLQHIPIDIIGAGVLLKKYVLQHKLNVITCSVDGVWKIALACYKNVRSRGVDCVELTDFNWWTGLLDHYLRHYRSLMLHGQAHRFVFCARNGKPFTESSFSTFLSNLTFRLTGKRVSTNLLRSSVITEFYGSDASGDPALQDSLANVMKHSPQVAKTIYNRNTSATKKQKGLKHLAGLIEKGGRAQLQGEGDLV